MRSKGPWTYLIDFDECYEVLDADGCSLADELDEDDASLIAAAPEMLDALKAVVECKYCILCESCRKKAIAAIAKAKGE